MPEKKCPHNKRKGRCIECSPQNFCKEHNKLNESCSKCNKCEHNKSKFSCTECKPERICTNHKQYTAKNCPICNIRIINNDELIKCSNCNINKTSDQYRKNGKQCKDCYKLKEICEHDTKKRECKICSSHLLCEHNKIEYRCSKCNPKSRCEHNHIEINCTICRPQLICEHDKLKANCKDCGGANICEHNNIKYKCIECNGSQVCEHKKIRSECKLCKELGLGGNALCECNIQKTRCRIHGGGAFCEHDKKRSECVKCYKNGTGGGHICEHFKTRGRCTICSPDSNQFCKSCKMYRVDKENNYLCSDCDPNRTKREKTKELSIKQLLEDNDFEFEYNKVVRHDCKKYSYPDFKFDCGNYYIILEVDENAHKSYNKVNEDCETNRMNEISFSLDKPVKFIRYNPDNRDYDKHEKERTLLDVLNSYLNQEYCEDLEVLYLYY
jgi:hypothetical protein